MSKLVTRSRLIYTSIIVLTIAIGIPIYWYSFDSGFGSDDYTQYAMLKGAYPVPRAPLDLFDFSKGKSEAEPLMDFGALPWWNYDVRLAMIRPLTSALIVFDHMVFGRNLVGFHIHSFVWWALLIISIALVLRELLPKYIAAIAVVLFAINPGHVLPIVWLANRSALIALSLGFFGFWAHLMWRRKGYRSGLLFSMILFPLALLNGEWAFTVFAYVFAFELLGSKDPIQTRVLAIAPAAILSGVFIIVQYELGYSALNSNVYINPISEPLVFLWEACLRIPVFLADIVYRIHSAWWHTGTPWRSFVLSLNFFTPPVWRQLPDWKFWHHLIGLSAATLAVIIIRWGLKGYDEKVRREFRWLLLGACLSLVPGVASFPSSRLAIPAYVGFSAAWAMVILYAVRLLVDSLKRNPLRPAVIPLLILLGAGYCQVWRSSVRAILETGGRAYFQLSVDEWIMNAEINERKVKDQDIFLINGVEHTVVIFVPFIRFWHGRVMPRSCRVLSAAPRAHDVYRTAANQLEISVLGGTLLTSDTEKLYRADRFPLKEGEPIRLREMTIKVLRLLRGKPLRIQFTFDKRLEDPSYLFLHQTRRGMVRFELPKIGEKVRLPKAQFPDVELVRYYKYMSKQSSMRKQSSRRRKIK